MNPALAGNAWTTCDSIEKVVCKKKHLKSPMWMYYPYGNESTANYGGAYHDQLGGELRAWRHAHAHAHVCM